jgi:hypothetical protein
MDRVGSRQGLPAPDRDIDELRRRLERTSASPHPLSRDDRGAVAGKDVEPSPLRVPSLMASATRATGLTMASDQTFERERL